MIVTIYSDYFDRIVDEEILRNLRGFMASKSSV